MVKGDFQIIKEKKDCELYYIETDCEIEFNNNVVFSVLACVHYNDILYMLRHIKVF